MIGVSNSLHKRDKSTSQAIVGNAYSTNSYTEAGTRALPRRRRGPHRTRAHARPGERRTRCRAPHVHARCLALGAIIPSPSTRRDRRRPTAHVPPPSLFGSLFGCKKCFVNMSAPVAARWRAYLYDSDARGRDADGSSQGALLTMKRHRRAPATRKEARDEAYVAFGRKTSRSGLAASAPDSAHKTAHIAPRSV